MAEGAGGRLLQDEDTGSDSNPTPNSTLDSSVPWYLTYRNRGVTLLIHMSTNTEISL